MSGERILAHFHEQAGLCTAYGSRFTGELIARMAEDVERGGPVAALLDGWPTNPRADALSLRLAGALHCAVLTRRDDALTAVYPVTNPNWRMDEVWPVARAFIERDRHWIAGFIGSAPQTNEVRRSIALLLAFLTFAKSWDGPVDMLEIGASAGLNLNWDRFAYRTASWQWGGDSAVVIDTDWHGAPPPVEARINVRNRAACDLNPLNIADESQRLALKAYIWADQPDRLARFDGAVALARANGIQVERADAATWLAERLASRAGDSATIVYHSIFLQYPPREARAAIVDAIRSAGAKASARAPLAWVRLEPEAVTDQVNDSSRMVIDVHTWPGGERRILGYTDGHVRAIHA